MAAIRSKDTKPEMIVRKTLHAAGFRYRLHRKDLPGKPDIVLSRYKIAVFVNGCFWHGHTCGDGHLPKSNPAYWGPKIRRNIERDHAHYVALNSLGWRVVVIPECEAKTEAEHLAIDLRSTPASRPEAR
jgi:DNA mismatch endonuclease (patch repair protein)